MAKVVHLSTVHPVLDHRVFHKEARSLARAGYSVTVIGVATVPEEVDGIRLKPSKVNPANRLVRMTWGQVRVFVAALRERADLYHLHDPELLVTGMWLKLARKRVVFDAHESLSGGLSTKGWIPRPIRGVVAVVATALQRVFTRFLDGVVVANPEQVGPFPESKTVIVQNFASLEEFLDIPSTPYAARENVAVYVGRLSSSRGIQQMVDASELVREPGFKLVLAGQFVPESVEREMEVRPGWTRVEYRGMVSRPELLDLLGNCRVGLVVMQATPSFLTNQPVKLFENMLAGIPSVVSNFSNYARYVQSTESGILVDPADPAAIAQAIDWLLDHPEEAEAMGARGKEAIVSCYNWEEEAKKLVGLYDSLLRNEVVS